MSVFGKMGRSFARTFGLSNRKRFTNKNSLRALKGKTMKNNLVIPQVSTRNISCKRILPHLDDDDLYLDEDVKRNIRKLCKYKSEHPGEVGYKGLRGSRDLSHSNKEAEELVNEITNYVNLKNMGSSNSSVTEKELRERLNKLYYGSKGRPTEEELVRRLGKLQNESPSMIEKRLKNHRSRRSR